MLTADFRAGYEYLYAKADEWRDAFLRTAEQIGADIVADIGDRQWGGVQADGHGLGIRTGTLFNSPEHAVEERAGAADILVSNRGATYWYWWDKSNGLSATVHHSVSGRPTRAFVVNRGRTDLFDRLQTFNSDQAQERLQMAMEAVFA